MKRVTPRARCRFAWIQASGLAISLAVALAVAVPSGATTSAPPAWELTPLEKAEYAASGSDAIVIGRIQSTVDTLTGDTMLHYLQLRPTLWLKSGSVDLTVQISVPDYDYSTVAAVHSITRINPNATVLCFLARRSNEWFIWASPSFYHGGIVDVSAPGGDHVALVRKAIDECRPEVLARRMDALVVGKVEPRKETCAFAGRRMRCSAVAVDSVVVGQATERAIRVIGPLGSLWREGQVALIVRRLGPALYRVVGFDSGAFEIREGVVKPSGEPLGTFIHRYRSLRAANAPPRD